MASLLLIISAAAVLISLNKFNPVDGLTRAPDADTTTQTGRAILLTIMIVSGVAALFHLITLIAARRENRARQLLERDIADKQESRSWIENFLDPQFLNTPTHIVNREKYFRSLSSTSRTYRFGLLLPAVALMVMLLIRLFSGASVFLGDPKSLDFGWKHGIDEGEEAEKSISFTPEFNSYGHAIQGLFAALLSTPVVMGGLIRLTRGKCKSLLLLVPYALAIYPIYNLIKRWIKSRDAFAGSSFSNNAFEWASGFILGLAIGQLITSICSCLYMFVFRKVQPSDEDEESQESGSLRGIVDEVDQDFMKPSLSFGILQKIIGFCLIFTVYAAAILFGLTWHSCLDGTECVNEDDPSISAKILAVMLAVPSVIFVGSSCCF